MPKISLKWSVEDILTAFTRFDVSTLEEETLNNLLKLFPTTYQMGRFGASEMDPNVLKTGVEIYAKMIQMPCVDKILHIAILKNQLADRLHPLSSNLNLLSKLSTEAIRSVNLRKVLNTIPTSHFLATSSPQRHRRAGTPAAPSLSNPLCQLIPDRGNGSKRSCSPSPTPSPPSPPRANSRLAALTDSIATDIKPKKKGKTPTPPPLPPPKTYKQFLPPQAHLRETEDFIQASRIEYGYAKLKAAGDDSSSIMHELCINLSKHTTDLMEFSIDSDIPCLKDAVGFEIKSWRQCQKELQDLRTEMDIAIVQWKMSIRKCIEAGSTRDMMDAFISDKEQELQKLSNFLTEVRTSIENLFYHLEPDRSKRCPSPGYLDEDEPIFSIFLKFREDFKKTAGEIQLVRQRAIDLHKVNLLDAILGAEELQLDARQLKSLVGFCPSEVQIDMFKHLMDEEGSTEKAEEKLVALLSNPKIHAKLKLLSVKKNLPGQAEKLRFRLTNLLEATKEILQSVELNEVVKLIALPKKSEPPPPLSEESSPGNNSTPSTPPAPAASTSVSYDGRRIAQSFDLKLLYKLRSKTLHDLVVYIAQVRPEVLDFHKTLPHLESGTQAAEDSLTIADDIRTLVRGIEVVESELKELESEADKGSINGAPDAELSHTISLWKTFLLEAQAEYESIFKLWGEARSHSFFLVEYFQENPVHFPVRHGFQAILNFVQKFQRSLKALQNEAEAEHLQVESEIGGAVSDAEEHQEPKTDDTGLESHGGE